MYRKKLKQIFVFIVLYDIYIFKINKNLLILMLLIIIIILINIYILLSNFIFLFMNFTAILRFNYDINFINYNGLKILSSFG